MSNCKEDILSVLSITTLTVAPSKEPGTMEKFSMRTWLSATAATEATSETRKRNADLIILFVVLIFIQNIFIKVIVLGYLRKRVGMAGSYRLPCHVLNPIYSITCFFVVPSELTMMLIPFFILFINTPPTL